MKVEFTDPPDYAHPEDWAVAYISVKTPFFKGMYGCNITTADFYPIYDSLSRLYNDLNGEAFFEDIEGNLKISIKGDGVGHFCATVKARSSFDYRSSLEFCIDFDQSYLPDMVNQLERIIKKGPDIN